MKGGEKMGNIKKEKKKPQPDDAELSLGAIEWSMKI